MPKIELSSGAKFDSDTSSTILDAALRAGVVIPFSCKNGRCGTCRCKVLNGSTRRIHPEIGLNEDAKADGWILSCVQSAENDLTLEVDDLSGVVLPEVRTLPCRISRLDRLSEDAIRVYLRLPPTSDFVFIPGQYVEVIGPNGVRRSYSLANDSSADKLLELHIRAVPGGVMSSYWFDQAKQNDLLRLNGPLGTFLLRDVAELPLIFLATGTGIAPVKAMLESVNKLPPDRVPESITVIWGGRRLQDLYLDLNEVPTEFDFVPVLSRSEANWSGAKGYVQDVLLELGIDLETAQVYACGSEAMIHSARESLIEAGLSEKSFFSDAFVSSGSK